MSADPDAPSWLQMPFAALAELLVEWENLKSIATSTLPRGKVTRQSRCENEVFQKLQNVRAAAHEAAEEWLSGDRRALSPHLVKMDAQTAVFALVALWESSLALRAQGGNSARAEWMELLPPGVADLLHKLEKHILP